MLLKFYTVVCACILKITAKPCMESLACERMELARSAVWNPSKTVWNQDRREGKEYSLTADAMPDGVGIPYTLKRDAIPSPSVLDKKTTDRSLSFFWRSVWDVKRPRLISFPQSFIAQEWSAYVKAFLLF